DAITNPAALSEAAKSGVAQINDAFQKARAQAPARTPTWMSYGLSSPEEFVSATVSDPRFQRWLSALDQTGTRPRALDSLFRGVRKIFGGKPNVPDNLYDRAVAAITAVDQPPPENRAQGPMYAANPFGVIKAKGLPHWLTTTERTLRQVG